MYEEFNEMNNLTVLTEEKPTNCTNIKNDLLKKGMHMVGEKTIYMADYGQGNYFS